jgi:bacteriocin-like protein
MINPKNNDKNNEVTVAGTDFFADSESFLNELTDDELQQVRGGAQAIGHEDFNDSFSSFSLTC